MKQKTRFLLHTAVFSIAALALGTSAWAQTFSATVWQVPGNDEDVTTTTPPASATLLGTFNTNEINFSITPTQDEPSVSLTNNDVLFGFLTGNGATISSDNISGANLAAIMTGSTVGASQTVAAGGGVDEGSVATTYDSQSSEYDTGNSPGCYDNTENTGDGSGTATGCYSEIIEITGTATFDAGTTYGVTHDDGAIMTITSGADAGDGFNSAAPTSAVDTTFIVGTTETDTFTLFYEATNGNPSVLTADFSPAVATTPEPGSLSLLFTMLSGVAGLGFMLKKKLS